MKKNIIKLTMIAAVAIFAGYNMYQANIKTEELSDIMMANVEALAQNEGNETKVYCCGSTGTCAKLIGGGEIVGIAFYTPCPK